MYNRRRTCPSRNLVTIRGNVKSIPNGYPLRSSLFLQKLGLDMFDACYVHPRRVEFFAGYEITYDKIDTSDVTKVGKSIRMLV
jgi:hypothetical protein